jgi:hypothetical protein
LDWLPDEELFRVVDQKGLVAEHRLDAGIRQTFAET